MSPTSFYGSWLALGLVAVVALLLGWQWAERRHRGADLSDADRAHFRGQDLRRWSVSGAMTLLAVGIFYGSRLPYKRAGKPNLAFLEIWLAVFLLILILIGLALADWLATRTYARRHRNDIVREGMEILRDEIRLRSGPTLDGEGRGGRNGSPQGGRRGPG